MSMSKKTLFYGKEESLPERTEVKAGPLTLTYEAGDLRYIKLGNQEILRRIYAAVRDHNWETIQPVLSNVQLDQAGDAFTIAYDAEHKQRGIDFFWHASITGNAKGTITFEMNGRTRSTFLRNRIGFCILHPMACADVPCRIEHVDGAIEERPFPQYIAPQLFKDGHPWPVAPFHQMRALSHQVLPNLWASPVRLKAFNADQPPVLLEKVAVPTMPEIIRNGITGQKPEHYGRDFCGAGSQQ